MIELATLTTRIVTNTGLVFQLKRKMPSVTPGQPAEPLIVTAIVPWVREDGEETYWVFAMGEPGSKYEERKLGLMTKIPKSTVVREDSFLSVEQIQQQLAEVAKEEAEAHTSGGQQPQAVADDAAVGAPRLPAELTVLPAVAAATSDEGRGDDTNENPEGA